MTFYLNQRNTSELESHTSISIEENGLLLNSSLNFSHIEHLEIHYAGIEFFPSASFPKLTFLNISQNNLVSIHSLPKLETLYISDNLIQSFGYFPRLTKLIAGNCGLDVLGPVECFPKLEFLDLNRNLFTLPPKFPNLRYLNLQRNLIDNIHGTDFPELEELNLDFNPLMYLPSFRNLLFCTACYCQIHVVDSSPKLLMLDLIENDLYSIPVFPKLKTLNLNDNNYLDQLPLCPDLEELSIERTNVVFLPQLNSLRRLYANGTRIVNVDYFVELEELEMGDDVIIVSNIYHDSENVHASSIQSSLRESLNYLIANFSANLDIIPQTLVILKN
ncbi:hypothetical protein GEMRC1_005807 [Eukaryota sp. GEM-RC1]